MVFHRLADLWIVGEFLGIPFSSCKDAVTMKGLWYTGFFRPPALTWRKADSMGIFLGMDLPRDAKDHKEALGISA